MLPTGMIGRDTKVWEIDLRRRSMHMWITCGRAERFTGPHIQSSVASFFGPFHMLYSSAIMERSWLSRLSYTRREIRVAFGGCCVSARRDRTIESSEHAPAASFLALPDNMNINFQSLSARSVHVTHSGRSAKE